MSKDWIERSMEPSIEELLSDPICRRIMQSDGLTDDDVRALVRDAVARPTVRIGTRAWWGPQSADEPARSSPGPDNLQRQPIGS